MSSVDEALALLREPERRGLQRVIDMARALAPGTVDGVSNGTPALLVGGKPLIGVTVSATHLSVFPFSPAVIAGVRARLDGFSLSKGTIRFAVDHPLPDDVLAEIVRARLAVIKG